MNKLRISIDLDGTICTNKQGDETYADVVPLPGAVEALRKLKEDGHYIIIHTARHMRTCEANIGLVLARQGKILFDWLSKWDIPYDEILFGKPHADVFIDDKGLQFHNWNQAISELKERFNV